MILGSPQNYFTNTNLEEITIQKGKKYIKVKECKFRSTTSEENQEGKISVGLRQNKLQTGSVSGSLVMESTDRNSTSSLLFDLRNLKNSTSTLYASVKFFTKDKKNGIEEEHECKSFIGLTNNKYEFELQTEHETSIEFTCKNCNKTSNKPYYILRIFLHHSQYEKDPSFIFESPLIIVDSKLSAAGTKKTTVKRKRETSEITAMELPSKREYISKNVENINFDELISPIEESENVDENFFNFDFTMFEDFTFE